ncbi:YdbL family protein [Thioflexithrix psekupsensis]|uniref:DUF1318 domain-containing protein n=1 Tax=Thioflexithrix psekupsensis TaxID=1570016 RepID=A0A251X9S6_9GAMM|nr:YdbL family protein [Thioflexithrix psekupsensis]OUD14262.1 hypothetical protein TPSD3_08015 [Thioflexithrix psekupsensis]
MMRYLPSFLLIWASFFITACVTINVYFPAAAAEKAADQIIDKVWGTDSPADKMPDSTFLTPEKSDLSPAYFSVLFHFFLQEAQASANIDISSPAIQVIQSRMSERHRNLEQFYDNGAIGLTADGFITVRDSKVVALKDRNNVNRWVNEENQDRTDLYREIARANGHPEWEQEIRNVFAARWIERAKKGWWYQDNSGQWRQK